MMSYLYSWILWPLKAVSWRLWSIAIFFASDSIGVIWVLASFHVRKLRFSLRRDRSEGSRFVLQMPFITLNNHAHSRDVALHLGLESSMYATDVDGSERLVLGRYFFFFFLSLSALSLSQIGVLYLERGEDDTIRILDSFSRWEWHVCWLWKRNRSEEPYGRVF